MAGPLHHHLGRDAAGESEANKGAAASMGANHLILREGFLDTATGSVVCPGDRFVETCQFAKVLQIPVHQLIGEYRQRPTSREVLVFVLIQNGLGETVQVDGKSVIGGL